MILLPQKQSTRSKVGRNKAKCAAYRLRVGKPSITGSKHPRKRRSR